MRSILYIVVLSFLLNAGGHAAEPAVVKDLAADLSAKRESLAGVHQEFEVTQTAKTAQDTQSSQWKTVLDLSQAKWREQLISGSGTDIRIYDGQDVFLMEEGGDEFVRVKHKAKEGSPMPAPYDIELDWKRAVEPETRPCGLSGADHICVTIQAPIRSWTHDDRRMTNGVAVLVVDTQTGLWLRCQTKETIQDAQTGYVLFRSYSLNRMRYGVAPEAALFKLPDSGLREVKQLTPWSLARIKKELVGKPAPALEATDIQGHRISLAELKGKTVLLDFWTTWYPPCRADAPSLDKLYVKYRDRDLVIIGISVSEKRETVQKFLLDHPHSFPIVLTTENELPRPYQVGAFPTYMVIAPDGMLTKVADGDQGFGELRKFLKKAGLDTE